MGLTTDPNDECLDIIEPSGMQKCYLILSDEERAKGFVRPVRQTYIHVGPQPPQHPVRDLTEEEKARHNPSNLHDDYVKFESYENCTEHDHGSSLGKYWTQAFLDRSTPGFHSGAFTTMSLKLAETYARDPHFYGGTFCSHCGQHFGVGPPELGGEFVWADDPTQYVGT